VTPALATTEGLSLRQATDLKLSCIRILPLDPDPWEIASQFVTFQIHFSVAEFSMSCPAFLNMKTLMVSMVESPFSFNHIRNIKILNAIHCSISLSQ
jgi:hypothetical protein